MKLLDNVNCPEQGSHYSLPRTLWRGFSAQMPGWQTKSLGCTTQHCTRADTQRLFHAHCFPPRISLYLPAPLLTLELQGSHSVACVSPKEEQQNFSFYQEILSQVIIIPVGSQTTPCNFRTIANFNYKWAINSWKLNMTGSISVLHMFFPSLLSQNIVWNKTKKVLPPTGLSPFYRANHHLYPFFFFPPPAFCCRLLFTKSIFLEWWPVKVEILAIETLGYIHKRLCKVGGTMPDELTTDSFIISRNRHINWLQYWHRPPALTKLFLILNIPPEHPLLNKMNNTGTKGRSASSEKAQWIL